MDAPHFLGFCPHEFALRTSPDRVEGLLHRRWADQHTAFVGKDQEAYKRKSESQQYRQLENE
ncbi:hypothetical protein [Ensifer sp. R-19]|uniref:hypothetical protein n=1 Tax=Ensifer sp. R-19 TaxID=3404055 RepID=UPI003CEF2AF4